MGISTAIAKALAPGLAELLIQEGLWAVFRRAQLRWSLVWAIGNAVERLAEEGLLECGIGKLDPGFFALPEVQEEIRKEFDPSNSFEPDIRRLAELFQASYEPGTPIDLAEVSRSLERFLLYLRDFGRRRSALRDRIRDKEALRGALLSATERDAVLEAHRATYHAMLSNRLSKHLRGRDDYVISTLLFRAHKNHGQAERFSPSATPQPLTAEDILDQPTDRLIIIGPSGFGKSTLLTYLARRATEDSSMLPILVHATELMACDSVLRLQEVLTSRIQGHIGEWCKNKFIRAAWDAALVTFFIDGLDQLENPQKLVWLFENSTHFGRLCVISAGRPRWPLVEAAVKANWKVFELQPFDEEQTIGYLGQLAARDEIRVLRRILGSLFAQPVILAVVKDLLMEHVIDVNTIRTRADLYDYFLDQLINSQREIVAAASGGREILPAAVRADLEQLSFRTLSAGKVGIFDERSGLEAVDWDESKFERLRRFEFIRVAEQFGDQWEFRHQSFQEYLAAVHLARRFEAIQDGQIQENYINVVAWEEVLLFAAGVLQNASRLIRLAIDVDAIFAGFLLGRSRFVEQEVRNQVMSQLEDMARSSDRNVADDALRAIFASRDPSRLAIVASVVGEVDEYFVSYAAWLLELYSSEFSLKDFHTYLEHSSPQVRKMFCALVGKRGSSASLPLLLALLEDTDAKVCEAAVEALGEIGDPTASAQLLAMLRASKPSKPIAALVRSLGMLKVREACTDLQGLLGQQETSRQEWLLDSMARLGCPDWLDAVLYAAEAAADAESARRLAKLISTHGSRENLLSLIEAFKTRPRLSSTLRKVMLEIDRDSTVEAWTDMLGEALDTNVRYQAVYGLGDAKCESAVRGLVQAFQDRELSISARNQLADNGTEEAVIAIKELMAASDASVRSQAIHAAVHAFREHERILSGKREWIDQATVKRAHQVLMYLSRHNLKRCIRECLSDNSIQVRGSAAQAVREINLKEGVEEITKIFLEDEGLQFLAGTALRQIAAPETIMVMMKCLEHLDYGRLDQAIAFLAEQGVSKAGPGILEIARTGGQAYYRRSALAALPVLKPEGFIEVLLGAASDESERFLEWKRVSAVEALRKVDDARVDTKLLERLEQEPNADALRAVIQVVGDRRVSGAVELLHSRFRSVDICLQREIIGALTAIGTNEALNVLRELMALPGHNWVMEVGRYLRRLPQSPAALSFLIDLVRQGRDYISSEVCEHICRYPKNEAIPALRILFEESTSFFVTKVRILEALSGIDDPTATELLVDALFDAEEFVRERAFHLLRGKADLAFVDHVRSRAAAAYPGQNEAVDALEAAALNNEGFRNRGFLCKG